jgi:DoxX-like family
VAAAAALLAGLALAPLGAAAAVGLALLMVGAGIHHHRASDPLNVKAPVAVLFVLAIITVFARLAST